MKKEDIQVLLDTIRQYNDVEITQTFTKNYEDWIDVKCITGTHKLELTYLQSGKVEYYESIQEAVDVIHKNISSAAL
ncbi:hypothetical protein [Planomicrobium sp. Y74]|uniref:hypothetical protein n=1 Tax=Planomicrobium sp. Y74 TaxID=2478977 RepID=UPI000EF4D911|nr:hypothetical protein [Planomicrobium sp. Y74]RLQ84928.1 hypothetical protein D9754_16825 [Planomicrobium sp. Y74]